VAAGLVTLAASIGFIVAASSLGSSDANDTGAPRRAAPAAAKPVRHPHSTARGHAKQPPKAAPRTHALKPKQPKAVKPHARQRPKVTAPPPTSRRPANPKQQQQKQQPKQQQQQRKPVAPSAPPATLPPFAWSPVAGASAYDFQLFRGPKLVYSKRTTEAGITVPSTWASHGKLVRLGPGSYRWYVWAVVGGVRGDRAVVQAKLDVPG
jgi:hypothetical protein